MTNLWNSADAYEHYMARWSRAVASQFLPWLEVGPDKTWLDVGCGTGALTQAIVDAQQPANVVGVEPSQAFIERARAVTDVRATFVQGDIAAAKRPGQFDAVVSGLVLNFLPDVHQAFREMAQRVAPGGVVGAYVWDYADGMQLMRYFWDAAIEVDHSAAEHDEGRRFSICSPNALQALFTLELTEVEVTGITVPTPFGSFHDYWQPFLGGVGTAPAYAMSLPPEHREELRIYLEALLPIQPDGSIHLEARAWAVKGRRASL